ncbi:MAG: TPM domain-containing protein [Anaerolineae bacterium]|nr:TPM domain-containing protein [Anaerolineae bacterium]
MRHLLYHIQPRCAHRIAAVCLVLLLTILSGTLSHAQDGYPDYIDLYINDFAGLLTDEDAANIRTLLMDLKRDTGIEAVVVTTGSFHDYGGNHETIRSFATGLFNSWGVGSKEFNNGVLILVAVNDRQVWIALGAGYGEEYNDKMQTVVDELMLSYFRQSNYSRGIYQGVRGVIQVLTGEWPPDLGESMAPTSAYTSTRTGTSSSTYTSTQTDTGGGGILEPALIGGGALGVLGAGAVGVQRLRRYRRRRCPGCGTLMNRLDETADDMYLESGQKLEEMLRSVDYDVWKCPNCGNHKLLPYQAWLSRYRRCPGCGYRTLGVRTERLVAPTYTSTGQDKITRNCRHCKYHDEQIVTVPQLTRTSSSSSGGGSSSSSSGGSFGGGSSSGGGAGGSW